MKDLLFSNVRHFRYERKFYSGKLTKREVERILKFHPAIFREIYHERTVNNIYFDSFGLEHYFDNINGTDRRLKVRIRWYGNLFGFIKNPVLELKLKHNLHVGKLLYPLKAFTLDGKFSIDLMHEIFEESLLSRALRLYLKQLNFCLLNSYRRKYFLSSDRKYRITADDDISFYKLLNYVNNFLNRSINRDTAIIEIKYNKPHDRFADDITNYLPFRLAKSSKYVDGITKVFV